MSAVSVVMLAAATIVLGAGQASTPGLGAAAVFGPAAPVRGAAASTSPPGESRAGVPRPVAVVRMTPPGSSPDPSMTEDAVRAAVDGASRFWAEDTQGHIAFRLVSVSSWTDTRRTCRDVAGLWREARRVAPDVSGGHLVVVLPRCGRHGGPRMPLRVRIARRGRRG
ncbi:hypothetical protein [Mobilicoccus pelagius]|uniref:Uncharacterized protein n=1 Tax=Mobilicoccus pelagius NBRC 104925 TaxID=1089455 RepID=H5UU20_9MICO|nr:hypothetical protein [Mobilicoccus pelagius]GAB49228.1 hypothetical protein MOPEL_099_00280 [Mobilicoccus pelagius NBRC 104925]